jgi:ATP-binding cassette, subfamily B, bacterial
VSQRINWNTLADEVLALEEAAAARGHLDEPPAAPSEGRTETRPPGWWTRVRHSLVWYLLRRQTPWIVTMLLLGAVLFALTIVTAQLTASIFDDAIIDQTRPLEGLVVSLMLVGIADFVFGFANRQVTARIGYQLEFDLRNLLYLRLQRAVPHDLDSVSTGQMVTRALTDLRVLEIVIRIIPELMRALPILLGILVYLLLQSVPLTVVAVSAIPINAYLINRIRKRLWGLAFLSLNQKAEITTAIDEPVRGIRVVKAFGQEEAERRTVADAAAKAYRYVMTRVRLEAKFDLLLRAAPVLVRAALLLFGARLVVAGHLSLGQFTVFFLFSAVFAGIAQAIDEIVAAWQMAKSGVGRIFQLLNLSPRVPGGLTHEPLPAVGAGLSAAGISVEVGSTTVLDGVDLHASPGELVVVTGAPGSGKSMLAAAVSGTFPLSAGTVTLDGVELSRLDPDVCRREIHAVSEEAFLFARSVRENLTLGSLRHPTATRSDVSDDDLRAALLSACADEIVDELDGGLDEVLGDRGMTLSGGQRQRLALARALVRPPRVLVLDDALSAVPPSLEIEILERIRSHAPSTSLICISRRTGPRRLADRVLDLGSGAGARAEADPAPTGDAPDDDSPPPLDVFGSGNPYDPRLVSIISDLRMADDEPRVPEEIAAEPSTAPSVRNIVGPVLKWVIGATILLVAMTAVGLAPEYVLGNAADAIEAEDTAATDRFAVVLVVLAAAVGVLNFAFRIASNRVNQDILYQLRRRIFSRLSRLGVDYYDRELPGRVSARVVHDLDVLSGFFDDGLYRLAASIALFVMVLGIMAWLSTEVALLVLLFAMAVTVLTIIQVPVADRAFQRARLATGDVVARLQEDFAGRYVVTAFGAERQARLEFGAQALELRSARRWATTVANAYTEAVSLFASIGAALIFWRAGNLALAGVLSTGMVLTLRLYLQEAMRPIPTMGRIWQDYLQARVALRQLAQPYDAPIRPVERPDARPCPPLDARIEFDRVAFTYPNTSREVLHEVSFEIEPRSTVAIVGYTGAGKSSIAKLLGRTYDPDAGVVRVDGHDLRDLDLASFRARIGIVPQDAFLFRGTVASNIAFGRPGADKASMRAAVANVGAEEALATIPGGLDARVEEEGRNLTAAQRQLIALARAWIVEPDVLVLDEATSSLDPQAESRVLDAVTQLGCTTVLIAHRAAVAERADRVIVLDRGRVVATGTHSRLLESDAHYAQLWDTTTQPAGATP